MSKNKLLQPLVSCIMPTHNRRSFVPQAIEYFLRQDYPNKELIIIDDGDDLILDLVPDYEWIQYIRLDNRGTVGTKRNIGCEKANGDIIIHWDDDDWMAPWRLKYQVENLLKEEAEISGLDRLLMYDSVSNESWKYVYPQNLRPWLAGGTLCYKRNYWARNPFPDINIGEDTRFVWGGCSGKMASLQDFSFYVAMIHSGNTSPKRAKDGRWHKYSTKELREMIGDDWICFKNHSKKIEGEGVCKPKEKGISNEAFNDFPLVSCILPTNNRKRFLPQAIEYFRRQDYPNRELVIVDDGSEPVDEFLIKDPRIQYMKLAQRHSIGAKRNIACEAAKGEIIIFWDDDDWYAPNRITYQIKPLVKRQANITGLGKGLFFCMNTRTFWTTTDSLNERMFFQGIISGTIAFWKKYWNDGARFPNVSLSEDVAFLKTLISSGISLQKLDNKGVFIYIRHNNNTWKFSMGDFQGRRGWREMEQPAFICKDDLEFYGIHRKRTSTQLTTSERDKVEENLPIAKKPLVSCILGTSNRRPFLKQAIKYFLRQSYENKELVIVDDGPDSCEAFLPEDRRIRYIKLSDPASLGRKLNVGIEVSNGQIVQKLDDDDYYHPEFLRATVAALLGHDSEASIVGFDSFLVLITATGELKFSGNGWCAGGTLCFYKKLWEKKPFRDVPRAVDWWFLKDHASQRIKIYNSELYILIRHNYGHLWKRMGKIDVTEYFKGLKNYSKTLRALLPDDDLLFYESLSHTEKKNGEMSLVQSRRESSRSLIEDSRLSWTGWAIGKSVAYELQEFIERNKPKRILELGSGLSTVLLADYAARHQATLISLSHESVYHQKASEFLKMFDLQRYVDLRLAPLKPLQCPGGHCYPWYVTDLKGLFDFVFIDGPPLVHGRQGTFFAIASHLVRHWVVWLHDAARKHEQECVKLWSRYFLFKQTVSYPEPRGLYKLCSTETISAHSKPSSGLGISILTGGRLNLLQQTVSALKRNSPGLIENNFVVALVNGNDPRSIDYLEKMSFVDHSLKYDKSVLPIGDATSMLMQILFEEGVETVLHLEDDWEVRTTDSDWLQHAQEFLKNHPEVGQLRLRHRSERVLPYHMVTRKTILWERKNRFMVAPSAHYTFNPSLIRSFDIPMIFPCRSEHQAQVNFLRLGSASAQLLPGVFHHIGEHQKRLPRDE